MALDNDGQPPELGRTTFVLALFVAVLIGCPSDRTAGPTLHGSPMPLPPPMTAPAPPALATFTKLRGPESVLYDPEQDVYFISNINGAMQSVDGNGFISRVDAATLTIDAKWIEGGRNGVRLDGPKGMAILGDALYVADITVVRKFDRRSGARLGEIPIDGASFLNDIATDGTRLYVSDTGILSGPGNTFRGSGSDAIWTIEDDRAEKLAGGAELSHPNGLDWVDGALRVVTFRGNELYRLDGGRKKVMARMPRGQLDGVIHLADGTALVSSWMGNEIYRVPRRGEAAAILAGIAAPADLGYDTKRRHLLVPRPTENQVTVHAVQ
jgi:DNA-binding beta-propeller fold protein YncE